MRYKKVLLLFPSYKCRHFGALGLPTGLDYIAETLKANNTDYDVVDMAAGSPLNDLKNKKLR